MKKLITVVIPTYKRPALLRRAIKSIHSTKEDDLDIIVIDDDTSMSAASIAAEFDEVRYFAKRGTQQGLSNSRNLGIDLASGKYIIFIDDDDYLNRHSIEHFKSSINSTKSFYYGDFTYLKKEGALRMDQSKTTISQLMVVNSIPVGSFMIEKSTIKHKFDPMMRSHEDWEFLLKNIEWTDSLYIGENLATIDKTDETEESMQNRKRSMFWLDYLSIYSKHPQPELAALRANSLSNLGIDIPAELLNFRPGH